MGEIGNVIPFRKGGKNVRWALIEDLHRSYMVGLSDEDRSDWLEQHASLSADEKEALKWEMEGSDRAVGQLLGLLKTQAADCIAELGRDE